MSQFKETVVGGLVTLTGTVIILDWMKSNNLDFRSFVKKNQLLNVNLYIIIYIIHYVLRALKTSQCCFRCQTYVFESRIAQGIQKWAQNNQLLTLSGKYYFFSRLFEGFTFQQILYFLNDWSYKIVSKTGSADLII